jgi:hypothetical protein
MVFMHRILLLFTLICCTAVASAQPVLVVEKIGSSRRHLFRLGEKIKLNVFYNDSLIQGTLVSIHDSDITVQEQRLVTMPIDSIRVVHKRFGFPDRLGSYLLIGGGAIFGIISVNHLINHEQVFTPDLFIISGSVAGAGVISKILSRKKCRIGPGRWKIKTFDQDLFQE